jgi:hypothetical protein
LQPIKEDPVSFIVQVAATAAGIPPPITAAAITAAKGGDIEDIGKAAVAAYVAPKVGQYVGTTVATATAGSALQNTLASAAGGAASGGTSALIQGGDVGQSIVLGGAGGAGASLGRELAAAIEYDVPVFSDQSRQLVSQDVGVNRLSDIGADVGAALGRSAVTGDLGDELAAAAQGVTSREISDFLRDEFSPSTASEEPDQQEEMVAQAAEESDVAEAENIIAEAVETNPIFAEDLQVAQIAIGDDQQLTTNEKLDVLAESLAREEFDKVAQSEDVAILPVFAAPLVSIVGQNLLRTAAVNSAPSIVAKIAAIAAQSPSVARVMATNPYVQQTLAAAGVSISIVGGIGVVGTAYDLLGQTDTGAGATIKIEPITSPSMDRLEEARQLRYAADIAETIPNADKTYAAELKSLATNSEQLVQVQDKVAQLNNLKGQGFSVGRELERVQIQANQLIPLVEAQSRELAVPIYNVTTIPTGTGARSPAVIDVPREPYARPVTRPGQVTAPGVTAPIDAPTDVPGVTPTDVGVSVPGREEGVVDISIPGVGAGNWCWNRCRNWCGSGNRCGNWCCYRNRSSHWNRSGCWNPSSRWVIGARPRRSSCSRTIRH